MKYIEYLPDTNIFGGGCKIVFTSGSDVPANPPLYKIINYSTRMILAIVRLVENLRKMYRKYEKEIRKFKRKQRQMLIEKS